MNDAHRRRGPPATFDDACRLIRELQSRNEALSAELAAREQAAADLQFSEAQYRAVIETSPDGFWVVDREGCLLEANETYARLSGYSRAELRGMHIADLEAEEDQAAVMAHMERIVEQGSDLFQTRHRAKSGRLWHAEINVAYWPLAGRRFFAFVRDVHRRQRAEVLVRARLRLSDLARTGTLEEVLRTALDIAEEYTASEFGFFHFVNEDQGQLTRQAWSTQPLQKMRPVLAPPLDCAVGEAGVWIETVQRRAPVIHNDATHLSGRSGSPGRSALSRQLTVPILRGEAVVAVVGVGDKPEDYTDDDVTMLRERASMTMDLVERKQAEETLRESEGFAKAVLDAVEAHIAVLDRAGVIVAVNEPWRRFACANSTTLGKPAESCGVGVDYLAVCRRSAGRSAQNAMAVHDGIVAVIEGRAPTFHCEYPCHSPGEQRWFALTVTPLGQGERGAVVAHSNITGLKRTEEALRESEQRFRGYFELGLIGMAVTSAEKGWLQVNDRPCEILGFLREDLSGKTWAEITHPDDLPGDLAQLDQVLALAGRTDRFLAMVQDISQRKQAERRIVESRNELQRVYDSIPVMICQLDQERKVVEANAFFRSRTGWPDNPINLSDRACGLLGCVHALDDARGCGFGPDCRSCTLRRAIQDTIDTGQPHVGIEYHTRLCVDGVESDFTALCSTAAIRNNGQPRVLLSLIDITDRKRAEQQLQLTQFSTDEAALAIFWLDVDNRVFYANAEACRSLGYSLADLRTLRACDVAPAFPESISRSFWREIRQSRVVHFESIFRRRDGSSFPVDLSIKHARYQGREYIFAFAQDITDRKRAELHLAESNERLRQLSQRLLSVQEEERRALARELHDDFGQQLGALKVNLAMLERDVEHAGHRRRLADCIEIAQYAREHIQDTARRLRPPILDDLGLAETLRWYARSQAERAGCVIEVNDRLANLSPELETAAFRIVQEAVSNAIRHGKARRIVIDAAVDGRDLSLVIADDGCGFDPQAISYGFQSGLGLIGMRERSALLGGRFVLASQPGSGVRIEVTLPLLPAAS
ncbi:PAS domain S-box protein [Accumulibacter sp.]|uniref:PAS domain S-box protein n=1 Tax=Accumulibacter sp. TaxID=2053492 RepID=UPI00261C75DF|nr:PAS domain S-box protein [Accumulibacter sp.]